MRSLRWVLVVALALPLAAAAKAPAAKGGKKGKSFSGLVVKVDGNSITVEKKGKKPETRIFKLTPATQFELVVGEGKAKTTAPATAANVELGVRVTVQAMEDTALTVKITPKKEKKPKGSKTKPKKP